MSKVVKGALLAGAIVLTGGAAMFAAPGVFATLGFYHLAVSMAASAFLSGVTAQLAGSKRQQRPNVTVEYSGTVGPRRILYGFNRVSGMHVIPPLTGGSNNKYLHKVLALAGHQVNAIIACYFNGEQVGTIGAVSGGSSDGLVSTGTFANKAWVRRYLGTSTQTADYILNTDLTLWTSDHRGRGVAYVAMQKEVDDGVWKTGDTTDTFDTEGKLCYDPRLDTSYGANPTSDTYKAYTTNPALQLPDYILDDALGLGESPSRMDWDMVAAAADICDELVAIPSASTQKRCSSNLVLVTTTPYEDNISMLAACMQGSALYSGGKWRIRAGCWETPSFEINDSNVMGPLELSTAYPYNERFNGIRGTFVDPAAGYQLNEFPPVQSATYVTADGESVFRDVQFSGCNDVHEAQRDAIVLTRKSRNWESATIPCDMSLWKVRPGQTGIANITELGWVDQQIRCEAWGFTPDGQVALTVRAENAADWDDPIESDYTTPLAISNPTPVDFVSDPPTALTALGTKNGVVLSWTAPVLAPSSAQYEVYEYTADTPFSSGALVWSGRATTVTIPRSDLTTRYYWVLLRMATGAASSVEPASTGIAGAAIEVVDGVPGASAFTLLNVANTTITSPTSVVKVSADAWDGKFRTQEAFATGAFISYVVGEAAGIGLTTDPTVDSAYSSVDYWLNNGSGSIYVYRNGVSAGTYGSYTAGDALGVVSDNVTVRYYKNGAVIYSHAVNTPGESLFGVGNLYYNGSEITGIAFGPAGSAGAPGADGSDGVDGEDGRIFIPSGNCVVDGNTAIKQGGSSAWDSAVRSQRGYLTCYVQFKFSQTNAYVMVGLNADPVTDSSYASIDAAILGRLDAIQDIYESGNSVTSGVGITPYTTESVFLITYDGVDLRYYKDNVLQRTTNYPGHTLFFDSSFYEAGAGINSISYGPGVTAPAVVLNAAYADSTDDTVVPFSEPGISNALSVSFAEKGRCRITVTGALHYLGPDVSFITAELNLTAGSGTITAGSFSFWTGPYTDSPNTTININAILEQTGDGPWTVGLDLSIPGYGNFEVYGLSMIVDIS